MLKKEKKNSVYMGVANEKGFSVVSMLLTLAILIITLPLLAYAVKAVHYNSNYDELSTQHFFLFLRNDIYEASDIHVEKDKLTYYLQDGKKASITKYGNDLRRQVDNDGHEIYLKNIKQVVFTPLSYGFNTTITTLQGEIYEKTIVSYE